MSQANDATTVSAPGSRALARLSLGYVALIGVVLFFSHGHYEENLVLSLAAAHGLFTLLLLWPMRLSQRLFGATPTEDLAIVDTLGGSDAGASERTLYASTTIVLVIFTLLSARSPELLYARPGEDAKLLVDILRLVPIASLVVIAAPMFLGARQGGRVVLITLIGIAIALVSARVLVLLASPAPRIDVWTSSQRAVDYFLQGKNPYSQDYEDIYRGAYDYRAGFPYWPAYLFWATGGVILARGLHDVRVSLVIAEALTALAVFGIARRRGMSRQLGAALGVTWLALPIAMFNTEQAWIDSLAILFVGGSAWAWLGGRMLLSGAVLGLLCATKQYGAVAAGLAVLHTWRSRSMRDAVRQAAACAAVAFGLVLPFVLADPRGFYDSSIRVLFDVLPRTDSLSLGAYFARGAQVAGPDELKAYYKPFTALSGLAFIGTTIWIARRPAGARLYEWAGACAIVHGFLFLFGKQAFCNYYIFLDFFVFLTALLAWPTSATKAAIPAPRTAEAQDEGDDHDGEEETGDEAGDDSASSATDDEDVDEGDDDAPDSDAR